MSTDQALYQCNVGDVFRDLKCWLMVEVMFEDVIDSSDALFQELHMQYKQLVTKFNSSIESRQDGQHLDFLFPMGGFLLLLRNCLVILPFLEFEGSVLLEKCGILVTILGSLCSSDLRSKVPCQKIRNGMSFSSFKSEISDACKYSPDGSTTHKQLHASMCFPKQIVFGASFLCSVLEVFLNELLVCQELKDYFLTADGVCSAKKVFISYGSGEDAVLEVISAHFLMSVCDEWLLEKFPHTLFWSHGRASEIPQLSLAAAMTFLGNLAVATAPKIFQAHLVSLVSSCIGISMPSKYGQLTPLLLSNYMSAFEESVNLYNRQILLLQEDDHSIGANSQSVWQMEPSSTFESHVRPETYAEINLQIGKLVNANHPHFKDALSASRSDLMSASMTYIKESQFILDDSCRDEACVILNCIIQKSLFEEIEVKAVKSGEISQHEVFLLASIVKLMSCSLLQIIWFMRISLKLGSFKVIKDSFLCGEYGFLISIIKRFVRCNANRPIQKTLKVVMDSSPAKHKQSKFILMHFAGMLSFSFDMRLEFLWKGCLFILMVLMNLLILEEGNLDALKPLLGHTEKCSFSASFLSKISELKPLVVHSEKPSHSSSCLTKTSEGLKYQRSSQVVASNLQKIQMVYMSKRCKFLTCDLRKFDSPSDFMPSATMGSWHTKHSMDTGHSGVEAIKDSSGGENAKDSTTCDNKTLRGDDPARNFSGAQDVFYGTSQNAPCTVNLEENDVHLENENETWNGEDFLKCRGLSLEQDGDLAEFIACKPGKDYSSWWKRRQRYRGWKHGLQASKKKQRHRMGRRGSQGVGVT